MEVPKVLQSQISNILWSRKHTNPTPQITLGSITLTLENTCKSLTHQTSNRQDMDVIVQPTTQDSNSIPCQRYAVLLTDTESPFAPAMLWDVMQSLLERFLLTWRFLHKHFRKLWSWYMLLLWIKSLDPRAEFVSEN